MFIYRYIFIVLLIILRVLPASSQEGRLVKIVSNYEILCNENTEKIKLRICLPQDIYKKQLLGGVSFSVKPDRIYDENGRKYADFIISEPQKQKKISIIIPVKIFQCDYNTLSKSDSYENEPDSVLAKFLIEEKSIEKNNNLIQMKAKELNSKNRLKTVQNIFSYVNKNIKYKANGEDLGARYAIINREGDCSEFSHLFIALCRANSIPARYVVGYVTSLSENQCHAWAEVYFDNIGWVPFDPTENQTNHYKKMKNQYVYLYFIMNDGEETGYTDYTYWYQGERPVIRPKIMIQ